MPLRAYRTFQTLILSIMGIFLLMNLWDGHLLMYIHQRFVFIVLLCALAMLAIAQGLLRDRLPKKKESNQISHSHYSDDHLDEPLVENQYEKGNLISGWNLWWMCVPLILGIFIPIQPMGHSAVAVRGISTYFSIPATLVNINFRDIPAGQRNIQDWLYVFSQTEDLSVLSSEEVDVTGFVVRSTDSQPNSFLIARFRFVSSAADALALGLVVSWPEDATIADGDWVRVKGKIRVTRMNGIMMPVVAANQVERTIEPEFPYLYP